MKQIIIILTLMFVTVQANAQQNQTQPDRKGFVVGAMVGVGHLSLSGNTANTSDGSGISLPNLKAGYMLNPDLAILLSTQGLSYEESGQDRSISGLVPTLQYWIKPNLWINGGIGLAMDVPAFYSDNTGDQCRIDFGAVILLSSGYEVYRKGSFSIDLQGVIQAGQIESDNGKREAFAIMTGIGFNFN